MAEGGGSSGLIVAGLVAAGAIAFLGLGGVDKLQNAFGSKSAPTQANTIQVAATEKLEVVEPIPEPETTIVFVEIPAETKTVEKTADKNEIIVFNAPDGGLTSDRIELPKSTEAVQVLKPDFLTEEVKADPKAFNEQKFGIDEAALQEALAQNSVELTTAQKLLIEAEKARLIFDSREITNF